eukprot:Rmarinus@m.29618
MKIRTQPRACVRMDIPHLTMVGALQCAPRDAAHTARVSGQRNANAKMDTLVTAVANTIASLACMGSVSPHMSVVVLPDSKETTAPPQFAAVAPRAPALRRRSASAATSTTTTRTLAIVSWIFARCWATMPVAVRELVLLGRTTPSLASAIQATQGMCVNSQFVKKTVMAGGHASPLMSVNANAKPAAIVGQLTHSVSRRNATLLWTATGKASVRSLECVCVTLALLETIALLCPARMTVLVTVRLPLSLMACTAAMPQRGSVHVLVHTMGTIAQRMTPPLCARVRWTALGLQALALSPITFAIAPQITSGRRVSRATVPGILRTAICRTSAPHTAMATGSVRLTLGRVCATVAHSDLLVRPSGARA